MRRILILMILGYSVSSFAVNDSVRSSFTVDANYVGSGCTQTMNIDAPVVMDYDFDNGVTAQKINGYVTCTNTNATITLTANGGAQGNRTLKLDSPVYYLPYQLCIDSGCTQLWPISSTPPSPVCSYSNNSSNNCAFNFYFRVPKTATLPMAGTYYDTITIAATD